MRNGKQQEIHRKKVVSTSESESKKEMNYWRERDKKMITKRPNTLSRELDIDQRIKQQMSLESGS